MLSSLHTCRKRKNMNAIFVARVQKSPRLFFLSKNLLHFRIVSSLTPIACLCTPLYIILILNYTSLNICPLQYYTTLNISPLQYYTTLNISPLEYYTSLNKCPLQYYTSLHIFPLQYYTSLNICPLEYYTSLNICPLQYYTWLHSSLPCPTATPDSDLQRSPLKFPSANLDTTLV